jgi:hypothetical protein
MAPMKARIRSGERVNGAKTIAVIAIFVCLALGSSGCKVTVGNKIEPGRIAQTGPETWNIDGKPYSIGSTYYVVLPPGERLQYTIEYLISDPGLLDGINDERAGLIAMPLMQYARESRLFHRIAVTSPMGGVLKPSLIGVAITSRQGANSRGFRVQRSMDEIGTPKLPAAAPRERGRE